MKTRKSYTKEFKLDAIALVRKQNDSIPEATRNLEVTPQLLVRWIKEAENDDGHAFRGNGKLTPKQEEIRKLKASVASRDYVHMDCRRIAVFSRRNRSLFS